MSSTAADERAEFSVASSTFDAAIDVDRFMGRWFVIAHLPTFIDRHATNAVEHYEQNPDGTIAIRRSHDASGSARWHDCNATGRVVDGKQGRHWSVSYRWLLRAEMRIVWVDSEYDFAVVAQGNPGHFRLLSRNPTVTPTTFFELVQRARENGFDASNLRSIPQRMSRRANA